jgi:release factor glutamine methyltransferase
MRKLSYIFYNYFYKYILKLYLKTDSKVTFDIFKLIVFKEVFHPKLFFSTKYFYSFLKGKNFKNKKFIELGSGSGILSMLAYRQGAHVTAVDIDPKAVENTRINFSGNFNMSQCLSIIQSDLFTNVPVQLFDIVVINPPYYFKEVKVAAHNAWYCGENGEYFKNLFAHLKSYTHSATEIFMVLEENCEIDRIKSMAQIHAIQFEQVDEKIIKWEKNFIFQLR